ncbi:hypothetical protein GCM10009785_14000 [Brooklawnia cerclae]|uniref:IrrE N-terminal-like domain-containing protein n=1 Tax=Brooklawnia cerclae TaxID=349934 RepID=A0ABX0SJ76_9ACTN|nr:hypothetical protein [Brooklawnia cerclae]NIH58030.1 hypothetical protein [Brooklawnia cerclae]
MHHPWRGFRGESAWTLRWAPLPGDLRGYTDWDARCVVLDDHLLQVERRVTICHETVHIERGPIPSDPVLVAREESAVEQETARRLIDVHDLGEALAWAHSLDEAADELWVDGDTLRVRLEHLDPVELDYLHHRLG